MDEKLQDKLQSILSDPGQMSGILQMAQQLLGEPAPEGEREETQTEKIPGEPSGAGLLSMLGGALGGGEKSKNEALLSAMMPYLRPERREKFRRAMKLSRMMGLAGRVMKEYGGDALGL